MQEVTGPALSFAPSALPTLAIQQLVAIQGNFPVRGPDGEATNVVGMVLGYGGGGTSDIYGAPPAQGQLLAISQATMLFSVYATVYGGNGSVTFALPNLSGRSALGGEAGQATDQTLTMTWMIAASAAAGGAVPVGAVALFGGNFVPAGWLACDGSVFDGADYPALIALIGTTYGGSGPDFAVPDLTGRAAYGAGTGRGLAPVALGMTIEGDVPGLGLTYMVCTDGIFPASGGNGEFPDAAPFYGQIAAYAGAEPPAGWALCDGSMLRIMDNQALYALFGTTYGGDGIYQFGLPDLRGRVAVGT